MRNLHDLRFLARDFFRYLRGADYFRQPQRLGSHFRDERCYYNDLRGKADWTGQCVDGVPALYVPALNRQIVSPVMVLLWGLGSLDRYFLEGNAAYVDNVGRAADWLIRNILPQGCLENQGSLLDFDEVDAYNSDNSCMSQGLALSFALRAVEYNLVAATTREQLSAMLPRILLNMLAPMDEGGTAWRSEEGLFLLEYCRKDHNVVLNGWIFGVFGLFDYQRFRPNDSAAKFLDETLQTMKAVLPRYHLPNGWSYYDMTGRISSPFYHELHIAMLDAVYRLSGDPVFLGYADMFRRANHRGNKLRYTLRKIKEKFTDSGAYASQ